MFEIMGMARVAKIENDAEFREGVVEALRKMNAQPTEVIFDLLEGDLHLWSELFGRLGVAQNKANEDVVEAALWAIQDELDAAGDKSANPGHAAS